MLFHVSAGIRTFVPFLLLNSMYSRWKYHVCLSISSNTVPMAAAESISSFSNPSWTSCIVSPSVIPGLPRWLSGKEFACNAGDMISIPGLGRSPGEGNGSSLQYSCLGNPMDRGAWRAVVRGVTKSSRGHKDTNDQVTHQQQRYQPAGAPSSEVCFPEPRIPSFNF